MDILKISVIPNCCNQFTERACSGMARAERRCSYCRRGMRTRIDWKRPESGPGGEFSCHGGLTKKCCREKARADRVRQAGRRTDQARAGSRPEGGRACKRKKVIQNKKGTARMAVPQSISPRPGRCCGVCGGAFLLPFPRAGLVWKAVPGCGRAPPGAWPPGATA